MPRNYWFRCVNCNKLQYRYRNVQRCEYCQGMLVRTNRQLLFNQLLLACEKFSEAHFYTNELETDAYVDPQDWAEFDAAVELVKKRLGASEENENAPNP